MQLRIMTEPQQGATYAELLAVAEESERLGFDAFFRSDHLPKPAQSPRPPIVIGGTGPRRTPRLAATFADEYNVPFRSVDDTAEAYARVRPACEQAGRDPGSMVYSTAQALLIGRDESDLARKIEQVGLKRSSERDAGLVGTPGEVVDKIGRFAEAGTTRVYLQLQDVQDLDQLSLVPDQFRS